MKTISLPCFDIEVKVDGKGGGSIQSSLHEDFKKGRILEIHLCAETEASLNAVESLILAHACAGVDIETPAYLEGIETAVEAIFNRLP